MPTSSRNLSPVFAPLALLLLLPAPWILSGFLFYPAYFIWRWKTSGAPVPRTPANIFVLLLASGMLVGLVVSPARYSGAVEAGSVLAGILVLYVLLDTLQTDRMLRQAAAVLALVGLGLVLLMPFRVSWSADKVFALPSVLEWTLRPPGQGTNPNSIAGMLAMILPLTLALLAAPEKWVRRIGIVSAGPILTGLALLQSRGAWFAVLGGLAIGAALYRRWLVPILPLAGLAGLVLLQQSGNMPALTDLVFGKIGIAAAKTLIQREQIWAQALELIRAHPLWGIGMGAYATVAPYAPGGPGIPVPHAHNAFLQVTLDAGVLGFTGFAGMMVLCTAAAWRAHIARRSSPLPYGILAALAVVFFHGMADSVFWGLRVSGIVWYLFALALAADALEHSRRRGDAS